MAWKPAASCGAPAWRCARSTASIWRSSPAKRWGWWVNPAAANPRSVALLIRLIPATAGYVEFDGAEVLRLDSRALREMRRGMQIVFQDPFGALNPRMSVEETCMEPLLIHGTRRGPEARAAVGKMLEMVGCPKARGYASRTSSPAASASGSALRAH